MTIFASKQSLQRPNALFEVVAALGLTASVSSDGRVPGVVRRSARQTVGGELHIRGGGSPSQMILVLLRVDRRQGRGGSGDGGALFWLLLRGGHAERLLLFGLLTLRWWVGLTLVGLAGDGALVVGGAGLFRAGGWRRRSVFCAQSGRFWRWNAVSRLALLKAEVLGSVGHGSKQSGTTQSRPLVWSDLVWWKNHTPFTLEGKLEHLDTSEQIGSGVVVAPTLALQQGNPRPHFASLNLPLVALLLVFSELSLQEVQHVREVQTGTVAVAAIGLLLLLPWPPSLAGGLGTGWNGRRWEVRILLRLHVGR